MTIDELKQATNEATKGPWRVFTPINDTLNRGWLDGPSQYTENRFDIKDARFIALAREYMLKLLEIAEAAKNILSEVDSWEGHEKLSNALASLEEPYND